MDPPTTPDGPKTSSDTPASDDGSAAGSEAAKSPPSAPDAYTDFKLPEGFKLEPEVLAQNVPVFKELNLTQDQAQKLVDAHVKMMEADAKNYLDTRQGWLKDLAKDPEIGSKLDTVKLDIGRALDYIGDPALVQSAKEALAFTGAGDNPFVIKTFYKLAQMVNEGRPVTGAGPSPHGQSPSGQAAARSPAQRMYPNLPS